MFVLATSGSVRRKRNPGRAGFERTFQLLADNPRMGRRADRIAPGVSRHEHGAHVTLYETTASGVLILAVVHGASVRRQEL